jgi:hypothetical protein
MSTNTEVGAAAAMNRSRQTRADEREWANKSQATRADEGEWANKSWQTRVDEGERLKGAGE